MLNRVTNRVTIRFTPLFLFIVLLIGILSCVTIAYSDNSQFHKREYQDHLKQDKPLFQSDDLATVLIWTGIDITKEITHMVETTNYIHKINPDLHFTTISHKNENYKFIGVDMMALYISLRNGIWSVYNVPFEDQYNPITKLYHAMLIEFYATGKELLEQPESSNVWKDGMVMF